MDSRRLVRNIGWLWVGYVARSLGYLLLVLLLTRGLGAAGFGLLSLFLAVALGISQVGGSWPFLAVPVLSAGERSIGAAFRPSAYVAAITTAACLVVAVPVCVVLGIGSLPSLACVGVSAISLVGLQGIFAVQQTEGRMGEIALLQALERVLGLILALSILAVAGLGVLGAQILLTVSSAATFLVAVVLVSRRGALSRAAAEELPDHPIATVMRSVGAMGIVSVASYGVAYADILILAVFRSNSEVGIYSLAYQIFSFVTALTGYWLMVALPGHALSSASGLGLREQLPIGRLMKFTGLWASLVGLCGVGFAFVLPLVFGSGFEKTAVPLLLLLGGSGVFAAIYYALLAALIGAQWSQLVARVAIASVVINVVLDLILVPAIGVVGPALATFAQSLVGTLVLAGIVLGPRATLRLVTVSAPVIAATMLLAIHPGDVALATVPVLAAVLTGLWSLSFAGASERAIAPEPEVDAI